LKDLKDEKLMAEFKSANDRAIQELKRLCRFPQRTKTSQSPRSTTLLAAKKYVNLLRYGEMIMLSPEQLLEIGTRELHRKQQVFAETAKIIDPNKKPIEVSKPFKRSSHRTDPDSRHGKNLR